MSGIMQRNILGIFCFIALAVNVAGANAAIPASDPRLKPPAPGPTYLSTADFAALKAIRSESKAKRFAGAKTANAQISDPIAHSLGEWMRFRADDPNLSFADADAFLDAHTDWPALSRIQTTYEKRLTSTTPVETVSAFFDSRDPVSGNGKIQLARALFASGDDDAAMGHLRDAWVNNNFSASEEKQILRTIGKRLTKDDHAARVDRLLWARQATNARRTIPLLTSAERRKAQARAAFILGASSAPRLYRELSRDYQLDSGVLLSAVRYYRRTDNEDKAIALSREAPTNATALRNPDRWWFERQLLMRWALKNGKFADAYELAAQHCIDETEDLSDAEFNAGWIALRFLNSPERAEQHFKSLAESVSTPISSSRAYYWLGRSAKASGNQLNADTYFRKAATYHYSYYGQLAAEELGGAPEQARFAEQLRSSPEDRALFTSRPVVSALRMLSDLNLTYEFMVFAYHIDGQLSRPGEYVEFAKLTNGEGAPHLTVRAGKVSVQRDAFAPQVSYPVVFVPDEAKRFVAPEIILGLSRQESEFNPRALSRAGARGMMQLLPSTAQLTAKKEGIRYSRSALLDDPVYNMTIGSAHLSHLIDRFDGSLIMTLSGYNAGPHRVDQWVATYGDPRTTDVDPVDWVELIPFAETRNYVQRVLENIQVYRGQINGGAIPGRLTKDLERGGSSKRVAQIAQPPKPLVQLANSFGGQSVSTLSSWTRTRAANFDTAVITARREQELLELEALERALQAQARRERVSYEQSQADDGSIISTDDLGATEPQPALDEGDSKIAPITSAPVTDTPVISAPVTSALPVSSTTATETEIVETAINETPSIEELAKTTPRFEIPADDEPTPALNDTAIATIPAPTPSVAASSVDNGLSELINAPTESASGFEQILNAGVNGLDAGGTAAAQTGLEGFAREEAQLQAQPDQDLGDECVSYREFIARNAEEEQNVAQDLNSGMLAELTSGGGC